MSAVLRRVRQFFISDYIHEQTRMIRVPPVTSHRGSFGGIKKVADFDLWAGRWLVFAKATAVGYGGNERRVDLRLKVLGVEGDVTKSDESYESAEPGLGASMTAILPFDVVSKAHFEVNVGAQFALAEFKHIVVIAVREK